MGLARVAYASYLVKVNEQVTFSQVTFQMCHRLKVDKTALVIDQLFLAMSQSYEFISWLS